MDYVEHTETLILDDGFRNVITPCGYHYEYNDEETNEGWGYPDHWVLVRNNLLDCSDIELENILKLAKHIHSDIDGLKYLWSSINKFVQVYSSLFAISPSMRILQTVSELEVLQLKLRKELEDVYI